MGKSFTTGKSQGEMTAIALAAVLLLSCLVFSPARAQDPEPSTDATQQQSALEISNELEQRQISIQNMESELGIYDPALIEAYADLGAFYVELEQFEDATDLYRRALQVARITSGLNSERQLPLVDEVINSSLASQDWESTDDMQHLRYYLKNRLYTPSDPRFAEAIDEMGQWKLRALRENLISQGSRGLTSEASQLSSLYRDGIGRIQASGEYSEFSLLPLYQGKSLADIEIARYLAGTPYQYFEGTVSQFVYQTVCNNVRDAQGNVVRNCYNVRRENPRYRQSQQDNKRMAVNRSIREVEVSIQNLNGILARNPDIPKVQREELESLIRQLQVEFQRIARSSRRSSLF